MSSCVATDIPPPLPSSATRQQGQRTSRHNLSSSDESSTSRDMLRLIAEKERRCFELREELASEELELKQLRSAWQRLASKDFPAFSGSQHRRDTSTASSTTSEVATEAWNSLSSKLPGSLKTQLNSLLESIANVEPQVPEPVEKDSLRPTGGLSVLEEEGSDVGSVAVSPRSPRSPAVGMDSARPTATGVAEHVKLNSMAAIQDSQALGFSVDSNGIAHVNEVAPPTPPKSTPARTRTSVLGSLSNTFQSKLTTTSDDTSSSSGSSGFASMFAKRLKEARENASDMLREAERKLGNAMTMDEFLGVTPPPPSTKSPQITLDEPSVDSAYSTTWVEAASGRKGSAAEKGLAIDTDTGRRLSTSSSRSSASRAPASPVIGGAPGAVFGMVLGSQSDLSRRASGDSWGWRQEDGDGWQEDEAPQEAKRAG